MNGSNEEGRYNLRHGMQPYISAVWYSCYQGSYISLAQHYFYKTHDEKSDLCEWSKKKGLPFAFCLLFLTCDLRFEKSVTCSLRGVKAMKFRCHQLSLRVDTT